MTDHLLNSHFKNIINEATDLVHVVSPDGIILFANDSWKRALRFSREEVIGRSIYSFVHPNDVEEFKAFREAVVAKKRVHSPVSVTFVARDGQSLILEGFTSVHLVDEQVVYTHSILRDVTLNKEQQRQLIEAHNVIKEREESFQQLIQHAPDAIIVIDQQSRIILWNPKSAQIFGWSFEEVAGTLLGETIIPPQFRKAHYEGMKRFLATGEEKVMNRTIEITALNKAGDEFYVALTISRSVRHGEPIFIAFIRDISQQKKMSREIEERKQELETINEELAQYASLASHDLKEPVRKILTFCDLLLGRSAAMEEERRKELLKKIQASALRMAALIESVNEFSSVTTLPVLEEPVSVKEVISEIESDLSAEISEKQAHIQVEDLPVLYINRVHVYQLFYNLITNALKYQRPLQSPIISITSADEPQWLKLYVSDNGLGFPKEFAQRMFEPFQRLHGKNYSGTGIGLSICRKIVERYGGRLSATGIVGEGSTFTISLPSGVGGNKK